ncbi:MAG: ABC transporter permease [Bdellovibrio sp.]|jgi:putative ABC transport system permease protein
MIILRLAWASLKSRRLTTGLTVLSIALSVMLLLSVERLRRGAEDGFTQAISQTDLIVGARSGPLNLLLYTVFNMGSATANVSWESYQYWKSQPQVEWTIPYSLGDGHGGFRTVATDANFYQHYRFRGDRKIEMSEGVPGTGLWDVVLGADVARTLRYKLGQKVVIAHGVTSGRGIQMHDDKPFVVVGIMKATGTALDQSLYISLEGMEALHIDWKDGAAPTRETQISPEKILQDQIKVDQITSFFLRTKSRIETLRLQRQINTYAEEPMMAIIPGVALAELWRTMGYVEQSLKAISWLVLFVGLTAMLIALLSLLEQRRREMAILRAMGAGPGHVLSLLVFEAFLISAVGAVTGAVVQLGAFVLLERWLAQSFGIYLAGEAITLADILFLLAAIGMGTCVGLVPAFRAFFLTLKDGLSVKA